MKIEKQFPIKWETVNFLEERITDAIWGLLFDNECSIPRNTNVKLTLEFEDND